jgi:hypothetical protein
VTNILAVNTKDPVDLSFYDGSGDPGILLDWQSGSAAISCQFSEKNYHELYGSGPIDISLEATAPTPDTILMEWNSRVYGSMPFYSPMDYEQAPTLNHTLDLRVKVLLYSRATLIDAGGGSGGNVCQVIASACKPLADMELVAAPIVSLEMNEVPAAGIEIDDAPIAGMICKMPS